MQNVYEIVKNMYSGILEIEGATSLIPKPFLAFEMKKYSKNWCIRIKSK